jgi:hypothetical protein
MDMKLGPLTLKEELRFEDVWEQGAEENIWL